MILLNNVLLPLDTDFGNLKNIIAAELKTKPSNIKDFALYRKSVDARKKKDIKFCCSFKVELLNEEAKILKLNKNTSEYKPNEYVWQRADKKPQFRPVIAGFGPAGMFAALTLARAGLCPIVLERGDDADTRAAKVKIFFAGGKLDTESNVQFGEGGAGTFSDGKLNTGIKNFRQRTVLEVFESHGAPAKILTDAKPHIGTDILINVVKSIRNEIISLGGEVRFNTKLDGIEISEGRLASITANGEKISTDTLVIATGHSARDTFKMLLENGVEMVKKPFAVGLRIEHLQSEINKALYGDFANSEYLGAADYKLAVHLENGRGVYTFCMCPGGEVINASSESGGIVVNGMSNSARNAQNSNSALLVGLEPSDFEVEDVLAGCALQEKIEKAAYNTANGAVPINTVGNFLYGKDFEIGRVKPSVLPSYSYSDFKGILPDFVLESLKAGIKKFAQKIEGFDCDDAILTAPETRSSSPVRIVRNEDCQSVSFAGIYPCGEGAGYAGGIVSAAVDGICVAEKIISLNKC